MEREYNNHLDLLTRFSPVNHSEEETDVEPPRRRSRNSCFHIIQSDWMSTELRAFLRKLDDEYIDEWETSPEKHSLGGSAPRERIVGNPPSSTLGTPVIGLWRNCYNRAWLQTLRPHRLRALKVINADYDFTIKPKTDFVQGSSRG